MIKSLSALLAALLVSTASAQIAPTNRAVTGNVVGQAAALAEFPNMAVVSGQSYVLTQLIVQTTTTTSGTYAIQSGTGTNCGTGTTAVFPSSATSARFNAPITTSSPAVITFNPPIVVTAGHAVCLIGTATNTITAELKGYVSK